MELAETAKSSFRVPPFQAAAVGYVRVRRAVEMEVKLATVAERVNVALGPESAALELIASLSLAKQI